MGNPYLTGRVKTIQFSGVITAATQTVQGGPMGTALADTSSQGSITCNGTNMTFYAYSKCDYGCESNLIISLTGADGYYGEQHETNGDGSGPSSSIDASGSWSVSIDCEEWAYIYTPASSSAVDGTQFPTFGGAAAGDGLPSIGIQYYLTMKPGGVYAASINSGSISLSHSFVIPSASSVGFLMDCLSICTATGGDSNTTFIGTKYLGTALSAAYSESQVYGGGTMAVNASGGAYATVDSQGGAQIEVLINPPIQLALNGRLKTFQSVYPGSAKVTWINSYGSTNTLTPNSTTGAFNDSVTQQEWSVTAKWNNGGWVNWPTTSLEQWQAPAVYLSNLGSSHSGDDPRDWRMQFRGFAWPAMSISRASSLLIDACSSTANWSAGAHTTVSESGGIAAAASGGIGSVSLAVPSAKRVWEAYRMLQISGSLTFPTYDNTKTYNAGAIAGPYSGAYYQALSTTTGHIPTNATYWAPISNPTVTLSVGLAGQTWNITYGLTSTSPMIDLCDAYSDSSTVGTKQSRNPITNPGGYPTAKDPTIQYSLGWGVQFCDSLSIGGIPDGVTVTFTSVQLASVAGAESQSQLTLLEPFGDFYAAWTSATDNTTQQPYLYIEADGRVLDIPVMSLVTPLSGPSGPSWVYYSISQLQSILSYFPGISATLLTDPSDGYHNSGLPGFLLGGSGSVYLWPTTGWQDYIDIHLPSTTLNLSACDLWDEVQVYPGAGQVWSQSGAFDIPTPLQVTKYVRGQGDGLVFSTAGNPLADQPVVLYETASTSTAQGAGITNDIGWYQTGPPWAFGNISDTLDLNVAPIPHLTEIGTIQNRQRFRGSFKHAPIRTNSLGYDVANNLRHVRTYANSGSGDIGMRCASNASPMIWTDVDTGLAGIWARPRFQDHGANWPIGLFYGDGTNCYFAQTNDEGNTWFNTTSMGSGLVGDFEDGANGLKWFFKVQDDSGTYNVYNRLLDSQLNVVRDWTITTITGIDNAPVATRESVITDGGGAAWRVGLFYSIGGVETIKFSQDGLNFS